MNKLRVSSFVLVVVLVLVGVLAAVIGVIRLKGDSNNPTPTPSGASVCEGFSPWTPKIDSFATIDPKLIAAQIDAIRAVNSDRTGVPASVSRDLDTVLNGVESYGHGDRKALLAVKPAAHRVDRWAVVHCKSTPKS